MIAMRRHHWFAVGALVLACAVGAVAPAPAQALGAEPAAAGAAGEGSDWSAIARWPDFMGGVWDADASVQPPPRYKAGVEAAAQQAAPDTGFDSLGSCEPRGLPNDLGGGFFFTKGAVFLMTDLDYLVVRRIDMVRKDHGDPELTYYGDSLGHWEGKALVIDTTGFLPQVQIAPGVPGNGHTEIIERYRMSNPDRMELELTVINPDLLQQPYVTTRMLSRHPDWTVHETYCERDRGAAASSTESAPTAPATSATPGSP